MCRQLPKCSVQVPLPTEIHHSLNGKLAPNCPMLPSCEPCFCDGCIHWIRDAERSVWLREVFSGQSIIILTGRNLVPSQHAPEALETYNESKHQESGLTGNKGFLRKAKGVCQPHPRNNTGEKMSGLLEKPLHFRPFSISPWESKHRTTNQPSATTTGDITWESLSSAPDADRILTMVYQGC